MQARGRSLETYEFPITLKRSVKVDVDSAGVTIEGAYRSNGHAAFARIVGVFAADSSSGAVKARTLELLVDDGRTLGISLMMNKPSGGTEGAPVVDDQAAMQGFHNAAASILRNLELARPELQAELGPTPSTRRLLRVIFGASAVVLLMMLLVWRPLDLNNTVTMIPYVGLVVVAVVGVWFWWLRKPKHAPLRVLADAFAIQAPRLMD